MVVEIVLIVCCFWFMLVFGTYPKISIPSSLIKYRILERKTYDIEIGKYRFDYHVLVKQYRLIPFMHQHIDHSIQIKPLLEKKKELEGKLYKPKYRVIEEDEYVLRRLKNWYKVKGGERQ